MSGSLLDRYLTMNSVASSCELQVSFHTSWGALSPIYGERLYKIDMLWHVIGQAETVY